ncbi:MAG: BlaI/MecI/CopY family transcriptional regulator [Lachnospiraceae bacterium]|nr:BlaI/MecI/CopY family transcriptional regulator [Lachnospiraceae bacterium]
MEKISDAEFEVMQVIWKEGRPMTPGEVMEHVSKEKEWKYSTLKTFLARLVQKGLLACESGRVNTYRALVSQKEYKRSETKKFLNSIHKGSLRSMLASLCKDDISEQKLDELMKEISEAEEKEE